MGERSAWFLAALILACGVCRADAVMNASTECLVGFDGLGEALENGGTVRCTDCDPRCDSDGDTTPNGSCTFDLRACVNDAAAGCTATELKKVSVTGRCGASALGFTPTGTALACGPEQGLRVTLKKNRRKPGKCKVKAKTKTLSTAKPRRVDRDVLTLFCDPRPTGESCPTTTTTTTTSTTTTFCPPPVTGTTSQCAPIVVGEGVPNSYQLSGTSGEKRCATLAAANRFGLCATDADCGGTANACLQLPWVTADGTLMSFPTGSRATFTVNEAGSFPACEHSLCIPCGNPYATCRGLPGCEVAGNPNGCIPRGTQGCCDQPGFIVPTFFVNLLGGLCSRVDQISCGVGVVNTSNPQTGDNEVDKVADTSDPGADCAYGTGDDPAAVPCNMAGADSNGRIVRTVGNGTADADGIQYRLTTPQISTTWIDGQSESGCADGSTFDDGETLISQLLLKSEPSTAGVSGAFTDQNTDSCIRNGTGFGGTTPDGPIVVGPVPAGPLRPQAYDGSSGPVTAAVSEVFTGQGTPLRDIGFVAITPYQPAVVVPTVACCCSPTAGCPE